MGILRPPLGRSPLFKPPKARVSEAGIPLASVVIDLCLSPKSNSAVTAIDAALADIRQGSVGDVPDHLRDAHYAGAKRIKPWYWLSIPT